MRCDLRAILKRVILRTSYNAWFLCENSSMGKTLKESNRQALLLFDDDELYTAAHIAALGLERGVWNDESDPEQAAKTFRMNLAKIAAKLPDEPDGYRKYPRQGRIAAWHGRLVEPPIRS